LTDESLSLMTKMKIPFNRPFMTGKELWYISEAHHRGMLAGDGDFTKRCHEWIENQTGCRKALLTHSCTGALEMAAMLLDIQPGDEVIMPSYTFVSTANAFVLRGAVPVFVDIREDTLNINDELIESAITEKTKAIVPVHYAGMGCDMDKIMAIADRHGLSVVEDAAQGLMATRGGCALGAMGHLGAISFHETKNVISGEGGALMINDERYIERAEIIREKGTNRSRFYRGEVDKYTWVDLGSSFLPGELIAAFLFAQMEEAENITSKRMKVWDYYHEAFGRLEGKERICRPIVPEGCSHNAHMYYLLLENAEVRQSLLNHLKGVGIMSVFHYIPLHSSPAGEKYGRACGDLAVTNKVSSTIARLPLYPEVEGAGEVIQAVEDFFEKG